jgi:hypothetical protein
MDLSLPERDEHFTDLLVGTSDRDVVFSRQSLVSIGLQLGTGDVMGLVEALPATANDMPNHRVRDHKHARVAVGGIRCHREGVGKWYVGVADGDDSRGRGRCGGRWV